MRIAIEGLREAQWRLEQRLRAAKALAGPRRQTTSELDAAVEAALIEARIILRYVEDLEEITGQSSSLVWDDRRKRMVAP